MTHKGDKEKEKDRKNLTRSEWKKKYGTDTHYYTNNLDKVDLTTGKTVRQLINEASKKHSIDPAFLASTLFSEGLDRYRVFEDKYGSKREQYNEFVVSGMKHLGLDTIGNRKDELFKKGYIDPEEYGKHAYEIETKNEKNQKVISADFKSLDIAIDYVAAFQRNENDILENHLKKNNIKLSPIQKTFFQNVAYNAGGGNAQAMVSSYHRKGYLKSDAFITERPDQYWEEVHAHSMKRTTAGMGLKEQSDFKSPEGVSNSYVGTQREEVSSVSDLQQLGIIASAEKNRAEINALNSDLQSKGILASENKLSGEVMKSLPVIKNREEQNSVNLGIGKKGIIASNNTPSGDTMKAPLKKASEKREKLTTVNRIKAGKMKTTDPELPKAELELREQFVINLQQGIAANESGNNSKAQNSESTAAGKYQFTKYWLDKAGDLSIKSFAKRNGFDVPTNLEDFKADEILQDSYFKFYAKEFLYPKAKTALAKGNPAGISLEQAGSLFHFKPAKDDSFGNTGAEKQINTGKFDPPTVKGENGASYTNQGSLDYMNRVAKAIDQPIKQEKLTEVQLADMPQKEKDKIANEYFTKRDKIIYLSDLDDVDKNRKIAKLQSEYKAKGQLPIINDWIDNKNDINKIHAQEKAKGSRKELNEMLDYVEEFSDFFYNENAEGAKNIQNGSINLGNHKNAEKFKEFAKKNGIKFNNTGNFIYEVKPQQMFKAIGEKYSDLTGEKFDYSKDMTLDENGNFITKMFDWIGNPNQKSGTISINSKAREKINSSTGFIEITKIDPSLVPDPKQSEEAETKKSTEKTDDSSEKSNTDDTAETTAEGEEVEQADKTDEWIDNKLGLLSVKGEEANYNPNAYKKEINFDAITGMALGLIGNEDAKKANIPLRTEQVSEAVRNYTSEIAKRSKEGLPVEVEAAMKNQLAEAYQGGLRNIVNASAGNRATVLGNQGQLEVARNKGLVDIQLADYEAKEKAFQQYGQSVQYMNDFNSRRDIANHSIKYQQGLSDQQRGRQLATAGFSQLTEALRYQKENGPGSANHMYKSKLMQDIFGFDPNMKDDESGTVPGTKSYKDAQVAKLKQQKGLVLDFEEKVQTLNPDQKDVLNRIGGPDKLGLDNATSLVSHLQENPDMDFSSINGDNIDQAIKKNNWGLLSKDRTEALAAPKRDIPEIKSLDERMEKEQDPDNNPDAWMNNDMGNGLYQDGSPAAPPKPVGTASLDQPTGLLSENIYNV
jgi:hypothetical protein